MQKAIFILVFTLCCSLYSTCQDVVVVDNVSLRPLAYANIGIPDKRTGTVTDEQGQFTLSVEPSDTVYISFVGYELLKITGDQLVLRDTIFLERQAALLEMVEVIAPSDASLETLGKRMDKRHQAVGFGSRQLGTAVAARIEVKERYLAQSAHFYVQHIDGEHMLYRLQIYDFKNGYVGEPLLLENVLIEDVQKRGLVSVDLTPYQLILDGDVLMSLEWIRDDEGIGNNGIMFRSKKARKSNLYMRNSSHEPFVLLKDEIRMAPSLHIGFYLMAYPLKD